VSSNQYLLIGTVALIISFAVIMAVFGSPRDGTGPR